MGEFVIQYHDFENAKEELKRISEQISMDLDLKKVDDSKGIGEFLTDWFFGRGIGLDHKVTGEELNELISQIQAHLHGINNTQNKLTEGLDQVYNALQALDKDYIQAIMVSIKEIEKTSQSIKDTQEQIKSIYENQSKTLDELKNFKQRLNGFAHIEDVDTLWNISECNSNQISELQKREEETKSIVRNNKKLIDNVVSEITEKNDAAMLSLSKKIKYTYLIAGSSLGIALIELIILLLG